MRSSIDARNDLCTLARKNRKENTRNLISRTRHVRACDIILCMFYVGRSLQLCVNVVISNDEQQMRSKLKSTLSISSRAMGSLSLPHDRRNHKGALFLETYPHRRRTPTSGHHPPRSCEGTRSAAVGCGSSASPSRTHRTSPRWSHPRSKLCPRAPVRRYSSLPSKEAVPVRMDRQRECCDRFPRCVRTQCAASRSVNHELR